MIERPDYIPISYLNQFAYCPRRFWLMFVHGELEVNAPMLDGTYKHRNAHHPGEQWHEDGRVFRSVWVWSDALQVAGIADFVEKSADNHTLIPLEHKRGRMGRWLGDHIQLCAQAMCLEERTGHHIERGEIFYWANRRREIVDITPELRQKTRDTVTEIFQLIESNANPSPISHKAKCRDCSMEPICLPHEVNYLRSLP